MNYYEHHLGDYAQATAHLTFVEDAAYSRLLRKYYAEEKPLPADMRAVQRLVAARTDEEREAVEVVLSEFFTLESDGWHNKRADDEIAKFDGKRQKARKSANSRWNANASGKDANASNEHANASESNADAMLETATSHNGRNALQSPDTRHQAPKKEKAATAVADDLFPGVRPEIVRDFRKLRAVKRSPITQTAIAGIVREAEKAKLTLDAALAICCERGWAGFKAEWLDRDAGNVRAFPQKPDAQPRILPRLEA